MLSAASSGAAAPTMLAHSPDAGLTSLARTRVEVFRRLPSGRFSPRRRRAPGIATGSNRCGYKTLSGRPEWPNRDPLQDGSSLVYAINSFDPEEDLGLSPFQVETIEGANLYSFVANQATGLWDGFGTSKGGKKDLSCEGFNKRSCPDAVAKALEEAKRLGQLKRAKALQALLKVIKRGGTMVIFWIEWYFELLFQGCPSGGGIDDGIAYNENQNTNDMASEAAVSVIFLLSLDSFASW